MEDCPFCNLNKDKTRVIETSEFCLVILSNPRLMPGHLLVLPKRHIEKPLQLSKEERTDLFNLLIKYQEKILKNISNGCDIRENYRPFQKQTNLKVHHLHFHLQPREFKDELYQKSQKFETELFLKLENSELERILSQLKI